MIQDDISSTLRYQHQFGQFSLLLSSAGAGLLCIVFWLFPGFSACVPFAPCSQVFSVPLCAALCVISTLILLRVGSSFLPHKALVAHPDARHLHFSQQCYRDVVAEYARFQVLIELLGGAVFLLLGAAILFAPPQHISWALFVLGGLSVLLAGGLLLYTGFARRPAREAPAAQERAQLLRLSLNEIMHREANPE